MRGEITSHHWMVAGKPAGGCTQGRGFTISWQNGPLGRDDERREPNGAFVEDVIAAALDRIGFYQNGQFACSENERAMNHLRSALYALEERTKSREERQVEGTHAV